MIVEGIGIVEGESFEQSDHFVEGSPGNLYCKTLRDAILLCPRPEDDDIGCVERIAPSGLYANSSCKGPREPGRVTVSLQVESCGGAPTEVYPKRG